MSTNEQEPDAKPEFSIHHLMYNVNRLRNKLTNLNAQIDEINKEKAEVSEELNANEQAIHDKMPDAEPHYIKFEQYKIFAVFPNRIKIIDLE